MLHGKVRIVLKKIYNKSGLIEVKYMMTLSSTSPRSLDLSFDIAVYDRSKCVKLIAYLVDNITILVIDKIK